MLTTTPAFTLTLGTSKIGLSGTTWPSWLKPSKWCFGAAALTELPYNLWMLTLSTNTPKSASVGLCCKDFPELALQPVRKAFEAKVNRAREGELLQVSTHFVSVYVLSVHQICLKYAC